MSASIALRFVSVSVLWFLLAVQFRNDYNTFFLYDNYLDLILFVCTVKTATSMCICVLVRIFCDARFDSLANSSQCF